MKKYLLAALLVLSASTFAANVTVFGGLNANGEIKFEDSKEDAELGYTAGVEAHKSVAKFVNGNLEVGLGTKYDSTITNKEDGEEYEYASSMPVYGSLKYTYKVNKKVNLYLQGKVGYAFMFDGKTIEDINESVIFTDDTTYYYEEGFKAELNGGLYTGVGIGAEIGNVSLGLSYDVTKATYKYSAYEIYDDYLDNSYDDSYNDSQEADVEYSKLALTVGYKFGK